MEDSLFTKIDESFVCENCGRKVEKLGYTCRNLEPIGIELNPKKGYVIIFKCKKCGMIRKNKAAKDDNMDLIIKLSANNEII